MKGATYTLILTIALFSFNISLNAGTREGTTILRFDKDVYEYILRPDKQKENSLKSKYPYLLSAFGRTTFNKTIESDSDSFFNDMRLYFSHPALQGIYNSTQQNFSDISAYEEQLTEAIGKINSLVPGKEFPQVALHVSGFKENVIIVDGLISISADKYLGNDYPAYFAFFQPHERQQMQPQMLVRDIVKAWLMSEVLNDNKQPTLLSSMVEQGKLLYLLSQILPDLDEQTLMGYTPEQLEWCKTNEKRIWKTIVEGNNLFSKNLIVIGKYIEDAAYTSTMSKQSPGRTGAWTGWQIIKAYLEKNEVSAVELLKTDAQAILKVAKYNP